MENNSKTLVFRGNLWKTLGKHKCSVGTYRNQNENSGFSVEPMEKMENHGVHWDPMENFMKAKVFRGNLWFAKQNTTKTCVL